MLNPNVKLWLAALRSGGYAQTTKKYATLKEPDGYTALGVLCELALNLGVIERYDPDRAMPLGVQVWVGWRKPFTAPIQFDTLQDQGVDFSAQADIIEANATKLFE